MKRVGFIVASLLIFFAILAIPVDPAILAPGAKAVAAVTVLMVLFWVTGVIPLEATALLPLVLFPLLGVLSPVKVAESYGNEVIFLFPGGLTHPHVDPAMEPPPPDRPAHNPSRRD